MAHHGSLAGVKLEFMEIGEVNFSWPGENGTLQDFGAVNYTLPSGNFLTYILLRLFVLYRSLLHFFH